MRSWTASPCTFVAAALAAATSLAPGRAAAEEVLPPPPLVDAAPRTTTTVTVTTQAAPPTYTPPPAYAPSPPPPAYAPPAPPYGATPAQGPVYFNGPVYVYPAPVTAQPLPSQSLAPLPPPPLVYGSPRPPVYRAASCCGALQQRRVVTPPRGPVFGMGLRYSVQGINQDVFDQRMTMMGGGLQLRFRSQGRFGFETAFDVLYANIGDGAFKRTSFPFTVGAMLYLFPNRPENHFNIFGLVGFGLQASDVVLFDQRPGRLNQQFLEVLGQAGAGAELRFTRLAITADIRAIGTKLDETSPAGAYYSGINSGPIPSSSVGYRAHVGTLLWF